MFDAIWDINMIKFEYTKLWWLLNSFELLIPVLHKNTIWFEKQTTGSVYRKSKGLIELFNKRVRSH